MNTIKPKILIVDDIPANLIALNALLKKVDADVIKAASGNEALQLVLEHDFALFLFDVQMPEMDGYELADILLQNDSTKKTPIIFLTAALRDEIHRVKGYSHGAIDYIEKPINDVMLLSKVRILLNIWVQQKALSVALYDLSQKNVSLQTEVNKRIKLQYELERMATYDALTDLPNRVLLKKEAERLLSVGKRYNQKVGVMFIDLDGFKAVNDNNGHESGNAILVETASRIKEAVRDIDIVGRYGGDEFVILLPDCGSTNDAEMIAQRIIDIIGQPTKTVSIQETIGASIGISIYPDDGEIVDDLISLADKFMYVAKKAGKNQFKLASMA